MRLLNALRAPAIVVLLCLAVIAARIWVWGRIEDRALTYVYDCTALFAWWLGIMFILGCWMIIDKLVFWFLYRTVGRRFEWKQIRRKLDEERKAVKVTLARGEISPGSVGCPENCRKAFLDGLENLLGEKWARRSRNYYLCAVLNLYRIVCSRGKPGMYVFSETEKRGALLDAEGRSIDGATLSSGLNTLRFLAVASPTVGFIGTLVGLTQAFGQATDPVAVLDSVSLCMTTSLLGAVISVVCLSFIALFEKLNSSVVENFDRIVSRIEFALHHEDVFLAGNR